MFTFYRYTFFYILYPVGVSGELLVYWTSLGYVGRTKMWSLELPNKLNFSISLWTGILLVMLVYIPRKLISQLNKNYSLESLNNKKVRQRRWYYSFKKTSLPKLRLY